MLSAFSNDRGGLLLGLAEESGFAPAPGFDAAKTRDDLASLGSDVMEPPVRADVDIADFEGAGRRGVGAGDAPGQQALLRQGQGDGRRLVNPGW